MTHTTDQEEAAWTVLVYMAGDNNLTDEMAWGLQELKKKAAELEARRGRSAKDRINVVAHFDPRGSRSRRYDFVPRSDINDPPPPADKDGDLHLYESMIYTRRGNGAGNGRAPNPLDAFVSEQVSGLPRAKRYLLVLSGHGSGAVGDFLNDSDPATSLSIPELARILDAARRAYEQKHGTKPRIDILGMDSCLMSNAEVCFEIREHADYLVASEGWVANAGWPYHRVLEAFLAGGTHADDSSAAVAGRIATNYSAFYKDYEISGISTDIAVCRLEAFREQERGLIGQLSVLSRTCVRAFDAVFVHDVVTRTGIDERKARTLVNELSGQIAGVLYEHDPKEKAYLANELANGSAKARARLREGSGLLELNQTKGMLVRELVEALGEAYGLDDQGLANKLGPAGQALEAVFAGSPPDWQAVQRMFASSAPASVALALVKMLRELDPGIPAALTAIEDQQRRERPNAMQARAMQARALLQKLHQVQWVLELGELAKNLKLGPADVQLLNAVVACRWRAQSFKAGVYVDLFDLCRCLGERLQGHPNQPRFTAVAGTKGNAVSISLHTGADSQNAQGLSVYFPCHAADYASEYDNLEFAKKTGWGRLVRAYLRATRRERRDETKDWADVAQHIVRFSHSEVDPLEADGIEARIVGVIAPTQAAKAPAQATGKEGTATKIREGTATKIREGTAAKIREGTAAKIRGDGVLFVWGNPPDGFFRPVQNGNAAPKRSGDPTAPTA